MKLLTEVIHVIHMQKDHIKNPLVHVWVQWIMETPNNPACTNSVKLFSDEVGHYMEEGQQSLEEVS